MPKKSSDPFMASLWTALIEDQLGPGGHQTGWAETPVRIRNRFIRAVRQVLQSGAAFQASTTEIGTGARAVAKAAPRAAEKSKGKRQDPRELQLPLMTRVPSRESAGKGTAAGRKSRR